MKTDPGLLEKHWPVGIEFDPQANPSDTATLKKRTSSGI